MTTAAATAKSQDHRQSGIKAVLSKVSDPNAGPTWSWMVGIMVGIMTILVGSMAAGVNARINLIETKTEANTVNIATMDAKLDYIRDEIHAIRRILEAKP